MKTSTENNERAPLKCGPLTLRFLGDIELSQWWARVARYVVCVSFDAGTEGAYRPSVADGSGGALYEGDARETTEEALDDLRTFLADRARELEPFRRVVTSPGLGQVLNALEVAQDRLDEHMGDTDPSDPEDPDLLAMQAICGAIETLKEGFPDSVEPPSQSEGGAG